MSDDFVDVINTLLKRGVTRYARASRLSSPCSTGLKLGVHETATSTRFWLVAVLAAFSITNAVFAAQSQDAEYEAVAEEYVKTYLAAHPLQGGPPDG